MSDSAVAGSGPATVWPSQLPHRSRSHPHRRDGQQSRHRLLRAAANFLTAQTPFTLAEVAAAADVSTATAYRHFRSADDLAQAFVAGFLDDVEYRVSARGRSDPDPEAELRDLCQVWIEAVLDWGPTLAHLRSPEGFLARRARHEPEMHRSLRHIEPTMRQVLEARHTSVTGRVPETDLAYALAIWNALSDPREVLDQAHTLGWSSRRITQRLHSAVISVIR